MAMDQKKGTQKILLVKGQIDIQNPIKPYKTCGPWGLKIDQNPWSPRVGIFLTHNPTWICLPEP